MSEAAAHAALLAAGVEDEALTPRHGWSNEAWLGVRHVARLSNGRFVGSFAHEATVVAALADGAVPHAEVVGHGLRPDGPGEWIVSKRRPGVTLADAWPGADPSARARMGRSLGRAMCALHELVPHPAAPSCWVDALQPGRLHDAYHPPPGLGPAMVAEAANLPGADLAIADALASMFADRMSLFAGDELVFAHLDVHGHNVLVDGREVTALLDWELAHPASPDLELDMLLRWCAAPVEINRDPGAIEVLLPQDLRGLVDDAASAYPGLVAAPHLVERLEVYDAHWHLVQIICLHALGDGNPATTSERWRMLGVVVEGRSHVRSFGL